jgi:Outer membrane protein beta-barrel domain
MPNYKSAVTLCVLLLLTLVIHESVNAQSEERNVEVGVQVSGLAGGRFGDQEAVGGGGRVTFNLTKSLALEGELNYFPSAGFDNVRRFQGQFGVKSGFRFERFGVFGKVRPGFINTKQDFTLFIPVPCPPGTACVQSLFPISVVTSNTGFSLDVGGVAEFYPSKRVIVRLDVGDTIANRQSPPFFISQPIFGGQAPPVLVDRGFFVVPGSDFTTHNLQLSAGVGFRF